MGGSCSSGTAETTSAGTQMTRLDDAEDAETGLDSDQTEINTPGCFGVVGTVGGGRFVVLSSFIPLIWFDLVFFANYALGWTLTAIYQPAFIYDNNVVRVFGVYNICLGVDSYPAAPIAAIIFLFAMAGLSLSLYIDTLRLLLKKNTTCSLLVRFVTKWVGFALCCSFVLTYAVPPNAPVQVAIHVWCFIIGLIGHGHRMAGH
mmetsp:Transcript_23975/g.60641  ORF Transcript_23975/g.60641 Transcript_23975/m.60641 type:complete len:203 (+) Transcript_23975:320-928(+)